MSNIVKNVGSEITRSANRAKLTVEKYSPEICIGLGIVGFVTTVVMACKATKSKKAADVARYRQERLDEVEAAIEMEDPEYGPKEVRKEKFEIAVKTTGKYAKVYGPSAAVGALSLACFLASYKILKTRYLGAVAALNAVTEAFKAYRKRVVAEEGEDRDYHYLFGEEKRQIEVVNEDGTVTKEEVDCVDAKDVNEDMFTRMFDCRNPNFDKNKNFCQQFIRARYCMLEDYFHSRGFILFNEILDNFGFTDLTPEGAVVGIIDNADKSKHIDITITDVYEGNEFVGYLMKFELDGVIFDQIGKKQK